MVPPPYAPLPPPPGIAQPHGSATASRPQRRGLGAGGIVAIVVGAVLVAGAIIAAALVLVGRNGETTQRDLANTPSAEPSLSADANPSAERPLSATGEVPFADGEWALYIPGSWGPSAAEDSIVQALPDGVEIVGVWQVTDSPNDLAFVGALPATGATDEQFEATATNSSRGLALYTDETSTRDPEWSTTVGGYRQVTVMTTAVFDDGTTAIQMGSVVILGDTAIYIVATSFEPHFGAPGTVTTIANGIE